MTRTLFALILLLFSIPATAQPGDDLYEPPEIAVLGRGTALTLDWHPSGEVLAATVDYGSMTRHSRMWRISMRPVMYGMLHGRQRERNC